MPGDYFRLLIGSTNYKVFIAGIDTEYYKGTGTTKVEVHHITCLVYLGASKMNSSNIVTGGYNGATIMQNFLDSKATELSTICGSHLLTRSVMLSTAATSKSYSWAWYNKQLVLMSETQVYGSIQWGSTYDTGEGFEQLPIFNNLSPMQLWGRTNIWLRGVYNAEGFCVISGGGYPTAGNSSEELGTVALFCLS